jgi:hypothetical protein
VISAVQSNEPETLDAPTFRLDVVHVAAGIWKSLSK